MTEEKRIYVVVAGTIQVPAAVFSHTPKYGTKIVHIADTRKGVKNVVQPAGRQIAQACHVVTKLRMSGQPIEAFEPMTTIILQARDSAELAHVHFLLFKKRLNPVFFSDDNPEYGPGSWPTAVAVKATKKQVIGILDYLPLWGAQ